MYYKYIGPGSNPNTARYSITLKLYTECILNANQWCPNVNISIFNTGTNTLFETVPVNYSDVQDIQNCTRQECHPCMADIPNICYKIATFQFTRDLPVTLTGYIISYQRCCRIANIINLQPGSSAVGDTWTVSIPGTNGLDPLAFQNSSAQFSQNDTAIICNKNYFEFDFSAVDPDEDSLAYAFSDAYYASRGNGSQCDALSDAPPFSYVGYVSPFSGAKPLGSGVTINPVTGIVSGIAPAVQGTYVLTCTVTEFKKGTGIAKSVVHKSLHINVADCSVTQALLNPVYFSCNGLTKSFRNESGGGNIQTYLWDFGVAGSAGDTSNLTNPSFTYPDTGTYTLKLVINRNLPCSDSATALVKVYPVFFPDFVVQGQCKNTPIQFIDKSTTTYGIVDYWKWDFGDGASENNSSVLNNPSHVYTKEANYQVSFTVANSKGCRDSLYRTILITDKPALKLTGDTLICTIDTLQLTAEGIGSVLWSPDYNISNLTSFNTLVSPDVPAKYYATITDPYGCRGTDSVFIDVRSLVTVKAGDDTTICQGDPVNLQLESDGLYYKWVESTAAASLSDTALKNPVATPLITTRYVATASIGKCFSRDDIVIQVVPYPKAAAGRDTAICFGTSAQLQAGGGSAYSWSPATYLNNPFIANPLAVNPVTDIRYTVTVTDTLGCPKPVNNSLTVAVLKVKAWAGSGDTSVVLTQPLQLNATGGTSYEWSPAAWLDNTEIPTPVSLPQSDIEYTVKVSNDAGCFDFASVAVKVYRVVPGIYVPTAFTPNGDGRNDVFRPVALGLKSLNVFRVYNRLGQEMFSDTNIESAGWNGTYKGNNQDPATYIWYAEGTDYTNKKIKKKGYVVLIR